MNVPITACFPSMGRNSLLERTLQLHEQQKITRSCAKWGIGALLILTFLGYDMYCCWDAPNDWFQLELAGAVLCGLCFFFCLVRYLNFMLWHIPVNATEAQRRILRMNHLDTSFRLRRRKVTPPAKDDKQTLLWHTSFQDSPAFYKRKYARNAPTWNYNVNPFQRNILPWNLYYPSNEKSQQHDLIETPYNKMDGVIHSQAALNQYLSDVSQEDDYCDISDDSTQRYLTTVRAKNSFWNYCHTATQMLRTSVYQLAPSSQTKTPSTPSKLRNDEEEESDKNHLSSGKSILSEIPSDKLGNYVINLRVWITMTILHRLAKEIDEIDKSFKNRGYNDMRIGSVSLERLRKTVENEQFVMHFMPRLPLILPFLEMSSNQEYLVSRIKELAEGSCIAAYQWNGSSAYQAPKWDEHLPNDAAIIFHMFCVYLDTQLLPLPQSGGGRPFFSRYVIVKDKKQTYKDIVTSVHNKANCAFLVTNPLQPVLSFISDNHIFSCPPGRNNLFHVIIEFLLYMRLERESYLEGVHMGKSGINIMCVIQD